MKEVTASVLASQRFLKDIPPDELGALAQTASEVMFPAGHRIFCDGDYEGSFWLIQSGYVNLDVQVPGQSPLVIGTVGIGGILGWSWVLPAYQWAFGAVCVTEVKAIQFDVAAVRDRCAADPVLGNELTRRLFQVLAGRLQKTRAQLIAKSMA